MAHHTKARPDFHATVELELRRRDWGFRTLAKKLAGDAASRDQIEQERRAVRRWLSGSKATPSQANRRRVAVALGLDARTFDDPDDEEESLSDFLKRRAEQAAREWELKHQSRPRDLAVVTGAGSEYEGV